MKDKYVCPSLLNVSINERLETTNKLLSFGIQWIHYDIMDSKFVNNKAIEVEECINIINKSNPHLSDVHLMVENPFPFADKLMNYVTCMTIHYEALNETEIIKFVKKYQTFTWIGLAIKPHTPFEKFKNIIHHFEIILVMSVEPGFGGQKFIESTYKKIEKISNFIKENKLQTIIQVDGGINDTNSKKIFSSGATAIVCGSYLINNLNAKTIKKML